MWTDLAPLRSLMGLKRGLEALNSSGGTKREVPPKGAGIGTLCCQVLARAVAVLSLVSRLQETTGGFFGRNLAMPKFSK